MEETPAEEAKTENISVSVRIRPLLMRELNSGQQCTWISQGNNCIVDAETQKFFAYDRVYSDASTNVEVFEGSAKPVLSSLMVGFNGCIFCYGQTGCGKTHTMHGQKKNPGIVPQAIEYIFSHIED
jgi:hypothetical protein